MLVAVYHNNQDIRLEQRQRPEVGADEVLIRVEASGICGSDVMEWYRVPRAPQVLGHEIAGLVEECGGDVTAFRPGQRVFATHHVPCGTCRRCASGHPSTCETLRSTRFDPGGFSEFVRVPGLQVGRGMLPLPDDVSFEEGSFVEPLACAVQGQRYAGFTAGQSVLVLAAARLGADRVFHASDDVPGLLRQANDGRLADRVVLCSAAPAALQQAFASAEPGGTILLFAPPEPDRRDVVPLFQLWRDEIALVSSYAASGQDLNRALELIGSGQVAVAEMISHRLPLQEAAQGFALTAAAAESLKVILLPHSS
jgi:L-iditol 2-dehydrogenase